MSNISIRHDDGPSYTVTIEEDGSATHHTVNVWPSDLARYAPDSDPETLLEASFRFLLAREPRESILRRFELAVIERYFPEYPSEIGAYIRD
jgi:hypothetical protein